MSSNNSRFKMIYMALACCLTISACQPESPTLLPESGSEPLESTESSSTSTPTPEPTSTPEPSKEPAEPEEPEPTPTPTPEPTAVPTLPPLEFERMKVIVGNGETENPDSGSRVEDMGLPETLSAVFIDSNDLIWLMHRSKGILGQVSAEITAPDDAPNFFEPYRLYRVKYEGLSSPQSVIIEPKTGDFYILERNNHRVIRLNKNLENITIIAGTGEAGYNAQSGIANQMQLNHPEDIALDAEGNLYITDTDNHVIRQVTPEGEMFTLAGQYILDTELPDTPNNNNDDPSDDDVPSYLPIGDTEGDGGPLADARLESPHHIAVGKDGAIYFTSASNTIRRIKDNRIDRYVGSGSFLGYNGDGLKADATHLATPTDLEIGPDGLLYFVDYQNRRVRRVNNGLVENVAGSGHTGDYVYSLTDLSEIDIQPEFISFDRHGNMYLYDSDHHRIRIAEVKTDTGI